ncbi:MAG: DUF2752 domain-containing protein [Blautia sp.]|nr:DUF2752 domain-containing protein [Blautia sp.]
MKRSNVYIKRGILACIILACLSQYRCPFRALFHKPCPGCGMTRAILACLRLDFQKAFQYHSLFPIVIITVIYLFFREKWYIGKKGEQIVLCVFMLLFLGRWCICIV